MNESTTGRCVWQVLEVVLLMLIGCDLKTSFFSKADGQLRRIFEIDEGNPSSSSSEAKSSAAAAVVVVGGGGEHGEGGR